MVTTTSKRSERTHETVEAQSLEIGNIWRDDEMFSWLIMAVQLEENFEERFVKVTLRPFAGRRYCESSADPGFERIVRFKPTKPLDVST